MKQKQLLLTAIILAQPVLFAPMASAAIEDVRAIWDQRKERLSVKAEETDGEASLTVLYNGQEYAMSYNSRRKRYDLRIRPTCYDSTISIVSSSGETQTKSVRVKKGSASGYECVVTPVCQDADSDGYTDSACGGQDCNDSDPLSFPGAQETCGDAIDQDCNGADLICVCQDGDGDGYTDSACGGQDCNDSDPLSFPGAQETCGDTIDQDCNGTDLICVCQDGDGDGYTDSACGGQDCNDSDPLSFPGAQETCGDAIDQDCNGTDLICVCQDGDGDGYTDSACGGQDCNDSDPLSFPGAQETCGDTIDQDCNGADLICVCQDGDGDGYTDSACGGQDCNDSDPLSFPGAQEVCGDTIDQDCSGADLDCETNDTPHGNLTFAEYPTNCLSCHYTEAIEMQNSTHYKWVGESPDMSNSPEALQGKLTNAVNSYCISIKGDWPVCGSCHVGRGQKPDDPEAGLENIDCLVCHNETYATSRTRLADGSMGVAQPTDAMVRNIHAPTRTNCLSCHAKAGGGDAVKRGDISLATAHNSDPEFDVHMNTGGSDLSCQKCHIFNNHLVIGKGSDLRPTDDLSRGSEISCTTCHTGKDSLGGHADNTIGRHVTRVACQTCHIPTYAKVATEVYRDWQLSHDGQPADGRSGPGHPYTLKEGNLVPEYRFWNRMSDNALLGDDASLTYDAARDTYPTSTPLGSVEEGKIYPFKYKKANQPMTVADSRLIALDTLEYIKISGDADKSVKKGLVNMGYSAEEPYTWVETDTYQLLNHGITPSSGVLQCSSCHESTSRIDLQGELGYQLKAAEAVVCTQCHGDKGTKSFEAIHDKHVKDKGYDCLWCHGFSRPERNLRMP
jgi:Cytochrome c bacterial/Putative metal-binding motif